MSKSKEAEPIFDIDKARSLIERGRRANWWIRKRTGSRGFKYFDANGGAVKRKEDLARVKSLVIPPAWESVRINPSNGGKIQAVGMDASGRVQYLYHPAYTAKQQRIKFQRIERFGSVLPRLRRITNEHIALDGLPREKVLAVAMRLINSLYFRVGTDLSAQHYKTYGITTLQKRHLTIGRKGKLRFDFVGKSHIQHRKVLVDEELAGILKEMIAAGRGRKLFRYMDADGKFKPVTPSLINAYLKAVTGPEFSSKDFRTWGATVLAAAELAFIGAAETEREVRTNIVRVVRRVAEELGNTPAVCRSSYIHPTVIDAYCSGVTIDEFRPPKARKIKRTAADLDPEEKALIRLLNRYRK
jgi:DNA topoisomerase-1